VIYTPALQGIPQGSCEDDVLGHKAPWRTLITPQHRKMCIQQLLDAIRSLSKRDTAIARRQQLADIDWVLSDTQDYPFSFENVCAAVHIDASACRDKLRPLMSVGTLDERMSAALKELEAELRYARGNAGAYKRVDGKRNSEVRKHKSRKRKSLNKPV